MSPSARQLPTPCLMLVTDRRLLGARRVEDVVESALAGGVNAVQLREKDLPAADLVDLAERLRLVVRQPGLLLINDRVDVALATGADGVELGVGALPIESARQIGADLLIGRSVHSVDEAIDAEASGADFLIVGTMFATASHPGLVPQGPELLRVVRQRVGVPLIGIGGVQPGNADQVMAAGANGVAVISHIMAAKDPRRAAADLRAALAARIVR